MHLYFQLHQRPGFATRGASELRMWLCVKYLLRRAARGSAVTGPYIRLAIDKDLTLQSILCQGSSRGTPGLDSAFFRAPPSPFAHKQLPSLAGNSDVLAGSGNGSRNAPNPSQSVHSGRVKS